MRPLVDFSFAILLILAAFVSLTIFRERWPRKVQFVAWAIAVIVCVAALLFRGFSGRGIDDVIGQYLANVICDFSSLPWCKNSKSEVLTVKEEVRPRVEATKVEEERRKLEVVKAEEERRKDAVSTNETLASLLTTVWMNVCTSARSARDAEDQLRKAGIGYLASSIRMVPHWSQVPLCFKITYPIPAARFGLDESSISYRELMQVARKYGATECPWELAPALRLLVRDQQAGDSFVLATTLMRRSDGSDGYYRIPQLGNKEPRVGAWLGVPFPGNYLSVKMMFDEDAVVSPAREFVFCLEDRRPRAISPIGP